MLEITKFLYYDKIQLFSSSISNLNCNLVKRSENLLKVRLLFYLMAFIHLVIVSIILLTIDFTKAEDPSLWMYANVRWKLITCWFNLLSLAYLPICMYCDLKELRHEDKELHVKRLNDIRFLIFTSILLPTTIFADILFWRLWIKDRELLAPVTVDAIVPFWTQHCMHTVSLLVTVLDVILVPRTRPKSFVPGLSIMLIFLFSYAYVCLNSYMEGEYLYPVFKLFDGFKMIVLLFYSVFDHLFYYFAQFIVYDLLWSKAKKQDSHKI